MSTSKAVYFFAFLKVFLEKAAISVILTPFGRSFVGFFSAKLFFAKKSLPFRHFKFSTPMRHKPCPLGGPSVPSLALCMFSGYTASLAFPPWH